MRFVNPIPFVRNIDVSRRFYCEILGLRIEEDHDNFVRFSSGLAIHEGSSLEQTIWGASGDHLDKYGRRNLVLYFEDDDIDAAFGRIGPKVELVHPVERQAWGQRVFRFYDPDGHVIEIGEPMNSTD